MDFKNLSIYGLILIVILIFIVIKFFILKNETKETFGQKILNYYGSSTCPHSRINSSMYNLINTSLKF